MADKQLARSEGSDRDIFSDDDPLSELARIVGYDNRPAVQQLQEIERARENVRYDPSLDLEAELTREFAAYDAPMVEAVREPAPAPVSETAPVAAEPAEYVRPAVPHFDAAALQDGARYAEEMAREVPDVAAPAEQPSPQVSLFDELDLERELEMSLALDIAPERSQPVVAPVAVQRFEPVFAEQPAAPVAHDVRLEAPVAEPHVPEPKMSAPSVDPIDALLADIEGFQIPAQPEKAAVQPDVPRKNTYPFTPTFSRATPVASSNGAATQRAFAKPLPAVEPVTAPVVAAVAPVMEASAPQIVSGAPSLVAAVSEPEPVFDLDNFELDLSDIELGLTEPVLLNEAPLSQPPLSQPPLAQAVRTERAFVEPTRVEMPVERTVPRAPRVEPADPIFEDVADESVLPFDPSMISETEETVSPVHDLHVPQLPVVEQERPRAFQPDYDLDLDAEMAQLFGAPDRTSPAAGVTEAPVKARGDVFVSQLGTTAKPSNGATNDYDAFERAMEEDFRQSLNQSRETAAAGDGAEGYVNDYNLDRPERPPMRRWALLAATVAGIAILGGGVYAFMNGTGAMTTSGEPKIILADKTPVKMVPIEKGGKTVPNQDKAVYDRVAGAQDEAPQQGSLVTSKEDPIDVVQRTLTPETLPLEGRSDAGDVTPVDDEGTDRLMPEADAQTATATSGDNATPAVSPRKVRTMIVRPDGTLVAREETASAPEATQTASTPTAASTMASEETPVSLETLARNDAPPATLQPAATATIPNATPAAIPSATAEVPPAVDTASSDVPAATVVPQTRPVRQAAPVKPAVVASAAPTASQQASPAASAASVAAAAQAVPAAPAAQSAAGGYVVQVASLPSEAEAQKSYNTLTGKFAFLGGKGVDIRKADIAGKGTYYRVRIPAGSRDDANSLCARYKSAGGSCLVTR